MSSNPDLRPEIAPPQFKIPITDAPPEPFIELSTIFVVLGKYRWMIIASTLIGILLAVGSLMLNKRVYSSTATIELSQESSNILPLRESSALPPASEDVEKMNADLFTLEAILSNDSTALAVIQQLDLSAIAPYSLPPSAETLTPLNNQNVSYPLAFDSRLRDHALSVFAARLKVEVVKSTRLITISFSDADPDRAAAIANATVDAYVNGSNKALNWSIAKNSDWLRGQLAELKDSVTQSQTKADDFQRQNGLVSMSLSPRPRGGGDAGDSVESSGSAPLDRLTELNRDLTNAVINRIAKDGVYRMTVDRDPDLVLGPSSNAIASAVAGTVLVEGGAELELLQHLRQQKADIRLQIAGASKYGAKNPVRAELDGQEKALDAQILEVLTRIRDRAKSELDLARLSESEIRREVAVQEQTVTELSGKTGQLLLLQEDAASKNQIYQELSSKLEETTLSEGIRLPSIRLVDPARPTKLHPFPRKSTTLAMGMFAGLSTGLILAFGRNYLKDPVFAREDLRTITSAPVGGFIPFWKPRSSFSVRPRVQFNAPAAGSGVWLYSEPQSQFSEAYRSFRTALLLGASEPSWNAFAILSPQPKDGRTSVCLNTAAAFTIQGHRVLLIDADLRCPSMHTQLCGSNDVGLSNCLTGECKMTEAVQTIEGLDRLFLLPSGPVPANPAELICSSRFSELLAEAKGLYDFVFIDTPPLLLYSDARWVASQADRAITVVRCGRVSRASLREFFGLLSRSDSKGQIEVLLNGVDATERKR